MGDVKKRGRYYWHRDPVSGQRRSTRCTDKKAAQLYHAERQRQAADPNYQTKDEARLGEWIERTLEHKTHTKSEGTLNMYRTKFGHLVRIFGEDYPLRKLTTVRVGDYISQRRSEGAGQSTIYRETVALSQMLKQARHARAWDGDPKSLMPLEWSPKYTPRKHHLTPDQVRQLMAEMTEEQRAWTAFVIATSARYSEAQRGEPEDFDPSLMVCRVRGTKTVGSERWAPVLTQFAPLWAIVGAFWDTHGRGPRWQAASHGIPYAAKRAGLPRTTPNDLRRTHASWLIQTGVDQGLVSRVLGHRDQTMVHRVYGQMTPKQLAVSVQRQVNDGTKEAQSAFFAGLTEEETSGKQLRPLGGNGRHRGFKIPSVHQGNQHVSEIIEAPCGDACRDEAERCTKRAHALRLAGLALRFDVLPDHVVTEQSVERRAAEMRGAA